ncbi:quinon protein alcohol dehydrogenase-like superfamily, partial [Mycena capillaripes]
DALAFSHDGRFILYLPDRNTVAVVDASTHAERFRLTGHTDSIVWAGAWLADGALIAVGAGDNMVRIWRVDTGELLHTLGGFHRWVGSLGFSPDNLQLAAGVGGGTLRVFNVQSGECEQT